MPVVGRPGRQHVIVGDAVEGGADQVRTLRSLIDGEVALRVALRLVDQLEPDLRAELVERHRGAGLRLAGGLIGDRAGDRREQRRKPEAAQQASAAHAISELSCAHRLHGLAAFAAELQLLVEARVAVRAGEASTAAATFAFAGSGAGAA